MIAVFVAAVLAVQGGSTDPRRAYVSCLKDAAVSAQSANVTTDGFPEYAEKMCASILDSFRAKLVSFNVKNGMSKKTAAEDAQIQLDDYMYTAEERYRYSIDPPQ